VTHAENASVEARAVATIEGQPNLGTFFVKPLLRGERLALLEIRAEAGTASAVHAHPHESLLYVVSGRLATTIADESFVLGPGDACRHPKDAPHLVRAIEDTVFVEIKSPPPDLRATFGLEGGAAR